MKAYFSQIILSVVLVLTISWDVHGQKSKDELDKYVQNRAELLKGKDFWMNDSVSLNTYLKFDSLVHNLYVHAIYHPKKTQWRTVNFGGLKLFIVKYDINKDEVPDEFVYESTDGMKTQEFGFMYDLNSDGKQDYIVYNGGVVTSHDGELYFYFYHMIDTNYDGLIDTYVSNVVNQPGDNLPDPHKVLWVSDIDGDKKAEVFKFIDIRNGATLDVEAKEGIWRCNTIFGDNELSQEDATFFDSFTQVLNDLNKF
jgi:hypothetical protein